MAQQGISFEQYLGFMGTTIEQFKEQLKPNALLQVKGTLALEQIAKEENLEVSEDDVTEQLKKLAESYNMELDKVKSFMRDEDIEAIKSDLKISKALDFIVENAKWSKTAPKKTAAKKEEGEEVKEPAKKTTTTKKTTSSATKKTTTKSTTTKASTTKKTTTTKKKAEDAE